LFDTGRVCLKGVFAHPAKRLPILFQPGGSFNKKKEDENKKGKKRRVDRRRVVHRGLKVWVCREGIDARTRGVDYTLRNRPQRLHIDWMGKGTQEEEEEAILKKSEHEMHMASFTGR